MNWLIFYDGQIICINMSGIILYYVLHANVNLTKNSFMQNMTEDAAIWWYPRFFKRTIYVQRTIYVHVFIE